MNDEAAKQPNVAARAERPAEAPENEAYARLGQVLGGKYKLEGILGSGGMAHVFRAVHEAIGRGVAIKILRKQFTFDNQIVGRFFREARTANSVRHPNVVSVMDVGTTDDGCPYLVQELLEGETLFDYLERTGPLELKDVGELISPILGAIAEAHASGVIHRDIKPQNVFLAGTRGKRVPKLLDFGISKAANSPPTEATAAGIIMGTPAYMAPELVRAAKDADARSDVWACGIMLFEVLTGRVPFEADSVPRMFLAIATRDAARVIDVRPDVPASLSAIVAKCLMRDATERYPTATELAADLNAALDPRELALLSQRESGPRLTRPPESLKARPRPIPSDSSPSSDRPAMGAARGLVLRPPPEDLARSSSPIAHAPDVEQENLSLPSDAASIRRMPTPEEKEQIESARKMAAAAAISERRAKAAAHVRENAPPLGSKPSSKRKTDVTLPSADARANYVTVGAVLLALAFVIVSVAMMR